MKELVILSGKGGTGKTSLTAAFASLAKNMVLCDADVDAADLHLVMAPDVKKRTEFKGGGVASIVTSTCTECGLCRSLCRFEAIKETFEIDEIACEGCGVCVDLCPEKAIQFPAKICGEWYLSETRCGPMVHARLGIAEENSGKLVTLVRQEARKLAEDRAAELIITDGPPGVGCPVIASLGGASALLIVAEPTVSGLHDMERLMQLAQHFKLPGMVCVNKADLNPAQTDLIVNLVQERQFGFIGRIPFDVAFTQAMVQGQTLIEYRNGSETSLAVREIWQRIMNHPAMNVES